jgi:hypothetical protein
MFRGNETGIALAEDRKMESLIFAANVMYLIAYFMTDILRLRMLSVAAAACLTIYFYNQPVPMLTVVGWNIVFVALNLFQIVRIVWSIGHAGTRKPARGKWAIETRCAA